ncbi:ABC transporter substrate-binding protein [Parapusillimonas sp. SGNA-6]|nr:ABC transporter substrate-binding protein [Parapusillimonas sp. SGNA-6]
MAARRSGPTTWLAALLAAALLVVGLPARGAQPDTPSATSTSAADPARPVMRAMTLAPHVTELIFAAGAGDRIVGTVISSDYPEAAKRIPRIGDGMNIDTERAIALRPDLVIGWQPSGAARTLAPVLDRLGIPLAYSEPKRLDDLPAEVMRMGQIFHTQPMATKAAAALRQRLAVLRARQAGKAWVRVFIQVGSDPLYTVGSDPLLNDVLATCRGVNVFEDAPVAAPQVSEEAVLQKQPALVIVPSHRPDAVARDAARWGVLHLPAAKAGHIASMNPDALFRPGPRLIGAAEELCDLLDRAR